MWGSGRWHRRRRAKSSRPRTGRRPSSPHPRPHQGLARPPRERDRQGNRSMAKLRHDGGVTWHTLEVAEVLRALETEPGSGLSSEEAARRLEERGSNELEERGGRGPWAILWEQFIS